MPYGRPLNSASLHNRLQAFPFRRPLGLRQVGAKIREGMTVAAGSCFARPHHRLRNAERSTRLRSALQARNNYSPSIRRAASAAKSLSSIA